MTIVNINNKMNSIKMPFTQAKVMKKLIACFFILTSFTANISIAALSQDPSLNWQTLYTEHFEIHFHDGEKTLANKVGSIAESAHTRLSKELNWAPHKRTQVILTDRFDFANGSATPVPRNQMNLIVSPPSGTNVISDYDNWLELLIIHEYTHILHLDKVSGFPSGLQKIFGRNLFLFPNILQPPWLIEGLATYNETDKKRGIGRGQGSLFRGLMRQEVINGIKPIHQVNQPLNSWPQNTVRYLYGVYFYQFIDEHYGAEKISELTEQYSNNFLPFAINSNSRRVLGKDMIALWDEFQGYLQESFSDEIESIQNEGEITGTQITHTGYNTRSPFLTNNGDIYFLENDAQTEPRLFVYKQNATKETSSLDVIADVRGGSFDVHPEAGVIGAEIDAFNNTNLFSDLYHIDLNSGKKTPLTQGKRYIQATWSPDGKEIIAVHNQLGQHALHRLDAHGNKTDTLWQGSDNSTISSIDWSPDGNSVVMTVWRPETLWNIERFDIDSRQWSSLTHDTHIENGPRFSSDGLSIVFSADYEGVFNIYQLTLVSNTLKKLTNVLGGATSPTLLNTPDGDRLVYSNLGANGYDLFTLNINHSTVSAPPTNAPAPSLHADTELTGELSGMGTEIGTEIGAEWGTEERAEASAEEPPTKLSVNPSSNLIQKPKYPDLQNTTLTPYNALSNITPTSWFPYFMSDDVRSEIGFTTFGSDPLRRHLYNVLLAYDTDKQWALGRFNYVYDRWNPTLKFSLDRQILTYLDGTGEIDRYRDSDIVSVEAIWPFFRYKQQWLLHAGIVSETESDKEVPSLNGPARTFTDRIAGLAVSFNSTQRYARSISSSYGRQFRLVAEDSDSLDSDYSGQTYILDWRELIDLPGQHVFGFRTVLGWGTDRPRPFRLGGTQETSVPPAPQASALAATANILGHRRYPLHGYNEGRADLRGRRMALIEAEWRFPIALVERGFMAPPIGLHQVHGKLIYNWGESWNLDSGAPKLRRGAGVEITAELVIGYWLPMSIRLGYAEGFDIGGEKQTYIEASVPLL
ncbi:MAG: PD40 domain-containing protein [Ectothiorhodospiraceae bacterium]|nr:PD40 domain-containing protein [Ectothiorhodospiraceae bacterium]